MRLPENESAISMLIQYIGDNYFEPRKNWPPDIFEEHIYERAAIIRQSRRSSELDCSAILRQSELLLGYFRRREQAGNDIQHCDSGC